MADIYPPRPYNMSDGTRTTTTIQTRLSTGQVTTNTSSTTRGHRTQFGSESRIGAVTPNYVRASATGNLPFLSLAYNRQDIKDTYGTYEQSITGAGFNTIQRIEGYGFGNAASGVTFKRVPVAFDDNLENLVRTKIQERLKDQDINIAQMYAERDQTMRLIATTIKRIGAAYSAIRSGNPKAAARALGVHLKPLSRGQVRSISSGWLELQYGWRPLINDIYGAAATLQKSFVNRSYILLHSSKSSRENWDTVNPVTGATERWTDDVTIRATLKVKQISSIKAGLSNLGLTNPATIAWELTPFSFVVDWLVPIGSFISQFDSSVGFAFEGGCITTFRKQTYVGERKQEVKGGGYDYRRYSYVQSGTQLSCSRRPLLGFYDLIALPYFKNPFSVTHVANALALFGVRR